MSWFAAPDITSSVLICIDMKADAVAGNGKDE